MEVSSQMVKQATIETCREVSPADLPLHCPMPGEALWSSHPRVYLPIGATGRARCPYCGMEYVLKGARHAH
ncbi:MAG TPA: zinc-finger domain-containing protein [Gammaproteobacteria bacterium]